MKKLNLWRRIRLVRIHNSQLFISDVFVKTYFEFLRIKKYQYFWHFDIIVIIDLIDVFIDIL
jgi:hypothetical protein